MTKEPGGAPPHQIRRRRERKKNRKKHDKVASGDHSQTRQRPAGARSLPQELLCAYCGSWIARQHLWQHQIRFCRGVHDELRRVSGLGPRRPLAVDGREHYVMAPRWSIVHATRTYESIQRYVCPACGQKLNGATIAQHHIRWCSVAMGRASARDFAATAFLEAVREAKLWAGVPVESHPSSLPWCNLAENDKPQCLLPDPALAEQLARIAHGRSTVGRQSAATRRRSATRLESPASGGEQASRRTQLPRQAPAKRQESASARLGRPVNESSSGSQTARSPESWSYGLPERYRRVIGKRICRVCGDVAIPGDEVCYSCVTK